MFLANSELLEYWVSKRSPDRLLACNIKTIKLIISEKNELGEHAVVDYEVEGSKVKTVSWVNIIL